MISGYFRYILLLCRKWSKVTCSSCFVNRNCSSFIRSRFGMLPSQPHACGSSHSTVSWDSHEPPIQQNNFTRHFGCLGTFRRFSGFNDSEWHFPSLHPLFVPQPQSHQLPWHQHGLAVFAEERKRDKANNMVDMIILRQFTRLVSLVRVFNFFWLMMAWHVIGCWAGLLSTSVDPVWAKEIRIDLMICMEYGGFLQRRTHFVLSNIFKFKQLNWKRLEVLLVNAVTKIESLYRISKQIQLHISSNVPYPMLSKNDGAPGHGLIDGYIPKQT